MWSALCGALLLLAFGSKAVSLFTRLVLLAVHKVGLLSNIRIDDRTKLQLTIRAVHIRVWRNLWTFVRSPTHCPLVTIEIAVVHAVVALRSDAAKNGGPTHEPPPSCDHGRMWGELTTATSLKDLDHPQWKQARAWMHGLSFVCFLLPIVGVSLSGVEVDVVRDESIRTASIMRLQQGNLTVLFAYKMSEGEVDLSVTVCPLEAAVITLPENGVEATLRDLRIDITVPFSRAQEDTRVPLPTSLRLRCDGLCCSIDLTTFINGIRRDGRHDTSQTQPRVAPDAALAEGGNDAILQAVQHDQGLLLLRLAELIPEVSVKVCNIQAIVVNGVNKVAGRIDMIECGLRDPTRKEGARSRQRDDAGEMAEERKLVVDLGHLLLSSDIFEATTSPPCSSISIEALKVEVETRLAKSSSPTLINGSDHLHHDIRLLWDLRCTGEVRGLSVGLADDLAPWVDSIHSLASRANSHCSANSTNQEVQDEGEEANSSCWDDILAMEMQVQFKLLRTDFLCHARKLRCTVLPNGVPDIGLSIDEVVLFAHPFIHEEPLGVRAKADLQASRLKIFYTQSGRLMRTSFLSIDFVRVLIEPVSMLGSNSAPAEVDMEAEWLEVRWTPEAMHAIGGLLELGIVILAPVLRERYDWTSDEYWDPRAPEDVFSVRPTSHIVEDHTSSSEVLKFRCKVKRSLVLFTHSHIGHAHVEYVTVDTFSMSIEETTGRFRLSVLDTRACSCENGSELGASFRDPLIQQQHKSMRRRPSTLRIRGDEGQPRQRKAGHHVRAEGSAFFSVKIFALEENKLLLCPMKVLDMFVDGVACTWDMKTQERIVELIRRITFSAWEMLYRMRSAYGVHCTPPDSRYNREGGINGVINNTSECDNAERLLSKLISAGGDTLNRIHATNIDLRATFGGQTLELYVGVFGSDDLPELWLFENVAITLGGSLKLLEVERVQVRHTVDKRRDFTFGFFEETLYHRRLACARLPKGTPRSDDMMIDIEGLRIGLSLQVDLVELTDAIQADISPLAASHMESFLSPWRPQEDIFYRFFFRVPNTRGQPRMCLQLTNIQVECIDQPMEAWLEHVYPLWMEELAEQELRSQLLDEQVTALKLANAELHLSDETTDEMKALLYEKSSKIYMHKVRRLQDTLRSRGQSGSPLHSGAIVSVQIGRVVVDVFSDPNERAVTERIRELDEATPAVDQVLRSVGLDAKEYEPSYALLVHQDLAVRVFNASVRMRTFPTPVAVIEKVSMHGHTIVAAAKSPESACGSFVLTAAVRCFTDLNVSIQRPVIFFGPAYIYTMHELAAIVERVMPSLVLDVDRVHKSTTWDIARRLVHGKVHLQVEHTALRLLATPNTFQVGDYLEVGIQSIAIKCRRGKDAATDVTIDRLTVKVEPDALVNIAEITSLTLQPMVTWSASCDASLHYILPIEYRKSDGSDVVVVDFQEGGIWRENDLSVDLATRIRRYCGTSFSASISGKISPKTHAEQLTRRDIASRSAIILYTKHVERLISFGRVYQTLTQLKFPSRRHRATKPAQQESLLTADSMVNRFVKVFQGVVVEEFEFIGLDVALYHSEKSQVGLRACINDKIAFSGAVKVMEGTCATPSRKDELRHAAIEWNGVTFVVDDVSLAVSDVQVRICTPSTGSRGQSLVSIRDVCLNVGGGQSAFTHSQKSFDFTSLHSELINNPVSIGTGEGRNSRLSSFKSSSTSSLASVEALNEASRTKSKINILEYFAIAHHNPFRYRDDNSDTANFEAEGKSKAAVDEMPSRTSSRSNIQSTFVDDFRRQGFLLGLSASEIRVLVTLDTVETLVDIAENWFRVIRASLPELDRVPDEVLKPRAGQEANAAHATAMDSPKKATSLADDPKFGPIFHASNPMPTTRTPSFNVEILPTEADLPAPQSPTSNGAGVVEPFLIVRFMDCQINFQDHQNKGSVLLALSRGTVRYSRSQNIHHELIDIKVDGVQLFTAPLDIDVRSRVIWLRTLDDGFTYCPSSFGLLRLVVAPIPAKVMVWVDRDCTVMHRVDLSIPTVQIGVHIDSKNILENLAMALTSVITAKFAEYQAPDYSKILQGFRGASNRLSIQSSLQQLLLTKKQLKWEIATLLWRHTCRWNYQVAERASLAMHAMDGVRSHGGMEMDYSIPSPFLHARRLSSASLIGMTSVTLTGSIATQVESTSEEQQRLQQQHDSLSEVLRSLVAAERLKHQPTPNLQLTFTLQNASLTLSATNSDIVSAAMTNLVVKLKMYDDQSGTFALTLQDVCCRNLCPNTPYPELLIPLRNSKSWSGDEMFVRIDAEVAPPVGGTKVVRHFEINVHPMQICLSYDLILQLVAFFASVSGPTSRQEEKKAEIRSQFLAAPHGSSSGEGLLRKAAKVAGKAAHPLTHGLGRHRANSDQDQLMDPRVKAMHALQDEAAQWISRVARAEAAKSTAGTDENNGAAMPSSSSEKDLNDMRDRTNNSILFKRIRLGTVEVMVSFKNKKNSASSSTQPALEDMRGFEVKIHSLVYSDKTCSLMDLLLRIQRDVILDVLSQVGRNFTNVATFLRDQLDITRWGTFDALAPLKSLSTAIAGTALSAPSSPANHAPSSPSVLSVEMLQRSPRVSHDASSSAATSSPSSSSTPVDTSKIFQLELPENHPSRRKKKAPQSRPSEPVGKLGDAIAVPISPLPADKDDLSDATPSTTGTPASGKTTRISLSSFFGKSKKTLPSTASIAECDEQ